MIESIQNFVFSETFILMCVVFFVAGIIIRIVKGAMKLLVSVIAIIAILVCFNFVDYDKLKNSKSINDLQNSINYSQLNSMKDEIVLLAEKSKYITIDEDGISKSFDIQLKVLDGYISVKNIESVENVKGGKLITMKDGKNYTIIDDYSVRLLGLIFQ